MSEENDTFCITQWLLSKLIQLLNVFARVQRNNLIINCEIMKCLGFTSENADGEEINTLILNT